MQFRTRRLGMARLKPRRVCGIVQPTNGGRVVITPQQRDEAARWVIANEIVGLPPEEAFPLMVREEIAEVPQIDLVYDLVEPE